MIKHCVNSGLKIIAQKGSIEVINLKRAPAREQKLRKVYCYGLPALGEAWRAIPRLDILDHKLCPFVKQNQPEQALIEGRITLPSYV